MAKFVTVYQPSAKAKKYIKKIKSSLQRALADFLQIGSMLKKAEVELGRKEWLNMVNKELPFTRRTAEKLVKIASDKRITNPKYAEYLPPHWTSLHEITLLTNAQFKAGIKSEIICPDADRKAIINLKIKKKAKLKSVKITATRKPADHTPDDNDPSQPNLGQSDQRRPVEGEQSLLSVAEFTTDREFTPEEAEALEAALTQFGIEHGLTLTLSGNLNHQSLLKQIEDDLFVCMDEMRRGAKDNDLQQITDAFFQFETGKPFQTNPDGSFHDNDLRNPDNPFGDFDKRQLYGYCYDLQLMTQYTPIEYLDTYAYCQMLMWRILTGNEKQRTSARQKLEKAADDEAEIKKKSIRFFKKKKVTYDEAHMNRNRAREMLESLDE